MGRKMARPKIKIDWEAVSKLCGLHCTGEEIAGFLEVSYDTLERACKRENKLSFAEYYGQKSAKGNISLRRKQHEVAMAGNPRMLIWLGKQYLGQTDRQEMDLNGQLGIEAKTMAEIIQDLSENDYDDTIETDE